MSVAWGMSMRRSATARPVTGESEMKWSPFGVVGTELI